MKKILLVLNFSVIALFASSQDNCGSAINLGTMPAPSPCPVGTGTMFTYNGDNFGATAENPYSSLVCMDAPAADVWFTFVASGNEMILDFTSGFDDANIGIYYDGACGNLTGLFCESSTNGNISTTLQPFTPGDTYYMQISGIDENDFSNFTLNMTMYMNCDLCVLESYITATPPPNAGIYLPGQTVQFCYTITEYDQVSTNWHHGVVPDFGAGWDLSTLTPISSPVAGGNYIWVWGNGPQGEGWWVDYTLPQDGNFSNNFGDPDIDGVGNWTFCWEITTDANCIPGGDAGMTVDTWADGETGNWTSLACENDPILPFQAIIQCCDIPIITSVPTSCIGSTDGSATAQGQGGVSPYDYVWTQGGATIYTDNDNAGVSSMSGLADGLYTVYVTDDTGCQQIIDITVGAGGSGPVANNQTPILCEDTFGSGTASNIDLTTNETSINGGPGISYTWYSDAGLTVSVPNPTSSSITNGQVFYVEVNDGACASIATVTYTINSLPNVSASNNGPVCANASAFSLDEAGGDAITWLWSSNGGATISTNDIQSPNVSGAIDGEVFTVVVTDVNGCSNSAQTTISFFPTPTAGALTGGGTYCQGDVIGDITLTGMTGQTDWTIYYTLDGTAMNATGSDPINLGNTPGVYSLDSIMDGNGCTNTASGTDQIVVNPIPPAPSAGVDTTYCSSDNFADMFATGSGIFTWYSDSLLNNSLGQNSTWSPGNISSTTTFYVTETILNCEGPATPVTITIEYCEIIVPTAISPDGDGINDTWEIVELDAVYPNNDVYIYNRWGALIFEHHSDNGANPYNDPENQWDGTYNQKALPTGSYFFIIQYNDKDEGSSSGAVTILNK